MLHSNFLPNVPRIIGVEGTDLNVPLSDQYRWGRTARAASRNELVAARMLTGGCGAAQ